MARAYSDDLRRKLLEAHGRGRGTLRELAERFDVSLSWAWKISSQRKRTGQVERREQRPRQSRVPESAQQHLRSWLKQQSDLTLVQLQQRLREQEQFQISVAQLWRVLKRMELRLKKSRSTPNSATAKRTSSGGRPSSSVSRTSSRKN